MEYLANGVLGKRLCPDPRGNSGRRKALFGGATVRLEEISNEELLVLADALSLVASRRAIVNETVRTQMTLLRPAGSADRYGVAEE
jgi:hypothetical protein